MDSKIMTEKIVKLLEDKKAKEIDVICIKERTVIADYFIICNGTSTTHIKALADEVEFGMEEIGHRVLRKEGYNSARWILLDYGDVIVHVFHEEDRGYYNLERLWTEGNINARK